PGREGANFVRPAGTCQLQFVFRNNQANAAFAGSNGNAGPDNRPVTGEQQHVVRQSADDRVQLHPLQAAADPFNSVVVAHSSWRADWLTSQAASQPDSSKIIFSFSIESYPQRRPRARRQWQCPPAPWSVSARAAGVPPVP